ncbi:MAG TPA: energy transducer TonB [Bryobacteraceae bacterium]|nr:energy transducer TonB [Bryobacteraceae bacterium]
MFDQTFVQTGKTNTTWTVVASFGVQIVAITVLVVLPLIYYQVLPMAQLTSLITAPPPPPPPPPPPAAAPPKTVKVIPRQMQTDQLLVPKIIPKEVKQINEEEAPPSAGMGVAGGVPGGVAGGAVGGVLGGILGGIPSAAPPPPPPEKKAPPKPSGPITVGGRVQAAKLIRQPQPVYPQIARQARISGTVELAAIIGEDGHIQQLSVVSGHPLLRQAALDAVKQWVYQPTLLNEQPVKVSTTIDVVFTLGQ